MKFKKDSIMKKERYRLAKTFANISSMDGQMESKQADLRVLYALKQKPEKKTCKTSANKDAMEAAQ